MRQFSRAELIAEARPHISGNRKEIEQSKWAECASCCAAFDAKSIAEWKDEWVSPETSNRVKRWTAICPKCGEAAVIGSESGLLRDQAYIVLLNHAMFDQVSGATQ
jgi:hypothetical protein